MLKTRITPATQPASTSTVAHPDGATGSQTQPPQVSGPRARTADRNFTNLPTRHAGARALKQPVKLTRAASKVDTRALAAAAIQPGLSARLESMRQYLAELKTAAHADPNLRVETPGHRDAEFLDLLVAVENARHPKLALSAHTISLNALNTTNPPPSPVSHAISRRACAAGSRGTPSSTSAGTRWRCRSGIIRRSRNRSR